jgi:hypothetical protein
MLIFVVLYLFLCGLPALGQLLPYETLLNFSACGPEQAIFVLKLLSITGPSRRIERD